MLDFREYGALKQEVDRLQREADRAAGERDQLLKRLKKDFNCETVAQAEAVSVKLQTKVAKLEEQYSDAIEELEQEWGETLGDK